MWVVRSSTRKLGHLHKGNYLANHALWMHYPIRAVFSPQIKYAAYYTLPTVYLKLKTKVKNFYILIVFNSLRRWKTLDNPGKMESWSQVATERLLAWYAFAPFLMELGLHWVQCGPPPYQVVQVHRSVVRSGLGGSKAVWVSVLICMVRAPSGCLLDRWWGVWWCCRGRIQSGVRR